MLKEIDVYNLPDSHQRYGDHISQTRQCPECVFRRTVINSDWGDGYAPIGQVCLWGKHWKWLEKSFGKTPSCGKLSRPLPPESVSRTLTEGEFIPQGIDPTNFTLELFSDVVRLYSQIIGCERLEHVEVEIEYEYAIQELHQANNYQWRLGSYVDENSKLEVQWRHLSRAPFNRVLFFNCYPNTSVPWNMNQGEYLNSRFQLGVNALLLQRGIAIPLR